MFFKILYNNKEDGVSQKVKKKATIKLFIQSELSYTKQTNKQKKD